MRKRADTKYKDNSRALTLVPKEIDLTDPGTYRAFTERVSSEVYPDILELEKLMKESLGASVTRVVKFAYVGGGSGA